MSVPLGPNKVTLVQDYNASQLVTAQICYGMMLQQ